MYCSILLNCVGIIMLVTVAVRPIQAQQKWTCFVGQKEGCTRSVDRAKPTQFELKLTNANAALANTPVRVITSAAGVHILNQRVNPDDKTTDAAVYMTDARGLVSGLIVPPLTAPVAIHFASVGAGESPVAAQLVISPNTPRYTLVPISNRLMNLRDGVYNLEKKYVWFSGSQLPARDSVGTRIKESTIDKTTCEALSVRYKAYSGTVSPDTTITGAYRATNDGTAGCFFETHWRLGDAIGIQHMMVTSNFSDRMMLTAAARRKPSIRVSLALAGLAGGDDGWFFGGKSTIAQSKIRAIKVEETRPDGKKVFYDDVEYGPEAIQAEKFSVKVLPLLIVDGPPVVRAEWLRLAAGASILDPATDFFAGFSVLQLSKKLAMEDAGFDAQLGVMISRDERLEEPADCQVALTSGNADLRKTECDTTRIPRLSGIAAMASVDFAAFVSIIGKFIGL